MNNLLKIEENKLEFSISIIGSFRRHYKKVLDAWNTFSEYQITIRSPKGTPIIQDNIPFVRFESDDKNLDDCAIQSTTFHRLFSSSLVYVVAPRGYIGRTTAYEIGRLIQKNKPLIFSQQPKDLPIQIPRTHIMTPEKLAQTIMFTNWNPTSIFNNGETVHYILERKLLAGNILSI